MNSTTAHLLIAQAGLLLRSPTRQHCWFTGRGSPARPVGSDPTNCYVEPSFERRDRTTLAKRPEYRANLVKLTLGSEHVAFPLTSVGLVLAMWA
jgi:hypothetical protein